MRYHGSRRKSLVVEIIKPSHYDDDGYVIQWYRAFVPSNSLACLHALVKDVQDRRALGDKVDMQVNPPASSRPEFPTTGR